MTKLAPNMPSSWPLAFEFVKDFDRTNSSIKSEESTSTDELDDEQNNDGEGVWSSDIEQSFHEALTIYPACGRRKIILSDEGKMFGRNELISRYIKMRTGKLRTRKQVSSHIQVLAKRKSKDIHTLFKESNFNESHRPFAINQHYHQLCNSTAASTVMNDAYYTNQRTFASTPYVDIKSFPSLSKMTTTTTPFIDTNRLRLAEFAAYTQSKADIDFRHYLLHVSQQSGTDMKSECIKVSQIIDLFPVLKELYNKQSEDAFYVVKVWVNMDYQENSANTYHYFSVFESSEDNMNICITTKACSFGKTVVEKIEHGTMKYDDTVDKCTHRSVDTTMCAFMTDFIKKIKMGMHMRDMMNVVLEHLGVLQTITEKDTGELLLCVAYIFEINESSSLSGTQSAAYRLRD